MESEDYVLCHWKGDLWPAKVLSRAGNQTHSEGREGSLLDVQILSMEKVQVRSTDVRPLTEAGIEAIVSSAELCLRANEFPGDALYRDSGPPGQASAHTEALKVALEILSCRKLAGQGTPVESPQSEPEAPRAQPGPGPCTGKKPPKRKLNSEPNLGKRACLPSHHMCHAGSEHALPVSVAHTATAASVHEMQAQVSESSSVSSLVPTMKGAINPSQSEKTLGAPTPESSGHPSSWKCRYAKAQFPGLYMRPVVVLTRFKDQSQKGEDAGEGIKVCDPHRITISPKGMEDSAKSASQAGLPGAGASSVSPNSWLPHAVSTANRKRKCQPAGVNTGAKKCKVPKTSNEPKVTGTKKEGEEREETQSKSVAPRSKAPLIETGMLVWFYLRGYPFWPSVVQSVDQTKNTARVLLIEPNLLSEQRGIQVPLCKLKPLECRSKDLLVQRASRHYGLGVAWCLSLITYYQEVVASGNFKGSFLEYLSSNGHFLVAEAFEETEQKVHFPVVKYPNQGDSEEKTFQDGKSTLGKGNFPGCVNGKMEKEKKEGTGEEQKIYEWEKSEKKEEKKEMEDMDKNWKEVIEEEREEEDKKDMVNELKEEEKVEKETQKEESMEEERREEEKEEEDKKAEEKELGEERLGKEKKQEQREKQEEKEEKEQLKRQEFHDVDKDKIMEQKEIEEDKETAEMVEVKMEQQDNLETEENVGQKEEEKIEEVMLKKEDEEKEKEQVKEVEEAEEKMEEDEVEEEEEKEDAKSKTMLEKENEEEEDKKQEEEEEEEEKKEEDEEEKEEIKGEEKEEEEKEEETEEEKKEEEKDKEEKREKEEKEEQMRYFRMILSDNYCKYT